jgi:hypothetical protein
MLRPDKEMNKQGGGQDVVQIFLFSIPILLALVVAKQSMNQEFCLISHFLERRVLHRKNWSGA